MNVLIMPSNWERALKCIVPYFHLLGTCFWLRFDNRVLKGRIMELEFEKKYLKTYYSKGFLATLKTTKRERYPIRRLIWNGS